MGSRGPNSLCGFGQVLLRKEQSPWVLTSEDFVPLTLSSVPTPQAKTVQATSPERGVGAGFQELAGEANVIIYFTELNNLGNCSSGPDNSIGFRAQLDLQS